VTAGATELTACTVGLHMQHMLFMHQTCVAYSVLTNAMQAADLSARQLATAVI
jgi:hypothetical protein